MRIIIPGLAIFVQQRAGGAWPGGGQTDCSVRVVLAPGCGESAPVTVLAYNCSPNSRPIPANLLECVLFYHKGASRGRRACGGEWEGGGGARHARGRR